MVLLVDRFSKFYVRLENDLHRRYRLQPDDFSAFLRDFESDVSASLNQLLLNSSIDSEFFSFPLIYQLLQAIPVLNKSFAKLVVNLEHPIGEWKSDSVNEYLKYTSNLLELFNSMSSSLSHLSQQRLLLSYALILAQTSPSSAIGRLKPIQPCKCNSNLKKNENKETEKGRKNNKPTKDSTIRQALRILRGIGLWICGISISSLNGDEKPYLESRKSAMEIDNSTLKRLDSQIYKEISEKKCVVKEKKELNEAAGRLIASIDGGDSGGAEKEMGRKVEEFEEQMEEIEKEVNKLFYEVLAGRSQILESFALASGRRSTALNFALRNYREDDREGKIVGSRKTIEKGASS